MTNSCEPTTTATTTTTTESSPETTILKPSISSEDALAIRAKENEVFKVFSQALHLYRADELMFTFNGGKDCTAVLHMLSKFYRNLPIQHIRIPVLYIKPENSFEEVNRFVEECAERYNIDLIVRTGDVKSATAAFMEEKPEIKATIIGCRRQDPYCKHLKVMQPTDPGWPPLMRFNPILDWSYRDVWNYILLNKVPYSELYDRGYTSLGNQKNTVQNPHLRIPSKKLCNTTEHTYRPAYELEDESLERAGRVDKKPSNTMAQNDLNI